MDPTLQRLVYEDNGLLLQLSREGWASIRAAVAKTTEPNFISAADACEALMGHLLGFRREGDYGSFRQLLGLTQHADHDYWPAPTTLVSTHISILPSPLLAVFRRNATDVAKRVMLDHKPKPGRPFHPPTRVLQVALHHDPRWWEHVDLMKWVASDRARDDDWYDIDQPLLAEDIEQLR